MAGYAMDLGEAGTEYTQGVTMPSQTEMGAAAEGTLALAKGIFGVMDTMMSSGKQQRQPTQAEVDRENYSNFAKDLQNLKGQEGLNLRTSLNSLIAKASVNGLKIDKSISDLVKIQTGIDIEYLNFDPDQEALNLVSKKLGENPAHLILAEQNLIASGITPTDQDILVEAIGQVQKNEAAALYLANSKNIGRTDFYSSYLPQATMALDNVRNLAMMGLDVELAGGNVSPDSIMQLRARFDVVKSQFVKPPLIQDDDWQNVQSQIDTLDQLLVRLETYDEERLKKVKAGIVTPLTEAIAMQAKTMDDPLAAFSILSNLDKVSETWINSNLPKVIELTKTISPENVEFTPLPVFPELAQQISEKAPTDEPTPMEFLHTPEAIELAKNKKPRDRKESIDFAYLNQVSLINSEEMAQEYARENFVRGLEVISLHMVTSPQLIDTSILDEVFSEDTFKKLKKLKQYDNDAYLITRERLVNALRLQSKSYETAVLGSFRDEKAYKFLTINRQTKMLSINKDAIADMSSTGNQKLFEIQKLANTYYDNDIDAMFKDEGRKIPLEEKNRVIIKGSDLDFEKIRVAMTAANTKLFNLNKYKNALRRLGATADAPEVEQIEQEALAAVTAPDTSDTQGVSTETLSRLGSSSNPYLFTGDSETHESQYNSLPSGAYFIDPSDNQLYRK